MGSIPGITRQWILAHHPEAGENPSQAFELTETSLYNSQLSPVYGPGGLAHKKTVIVQPIWLSNDPTQRPWIGEKGSYITVRIGEVMKSWGVGKVVESYKPEFKRGDLVWGMLAWSEYMLFENPNTRYPPGLNILTEEQAENPATYIAAGLTGLTAYYGLLKAGEATSADETIVVSTAAGATGAMVVQIAKHILKIPRVVGITSSSQKMAMIKGLGCDIALNYKSPTFEADLAVATSRGIDLYFDHVGGYMLDMMLKRMNVRGRVVACGSIGSYTNDNTAEAAYTRELRRIIMSGVKIQGFNVGHYAPDFPNGQKELGGWIKEGKIKVLTTIFETAFEGVPEGMDKLFRGENEGKLVTKIK